MQNVKCKMQNAKCKKESCPMKLKQLSNQVATLTTFPTPEERDRQVFRHFSEESGSTHKR